MIIELSKKPNNFDENKYRSVTLNGKHYLVTLDTDVDLDSIDTPIVNVVDSDDGLLFTSRSFQKEDTIIDVNGSLIGGNNFTFIAGPCSVDSLVNLEDISQVLVNSNTKFLRAGAFKPRTNPYSFQGMKEVGLDYLKKVKEKYNLNIVVELTSASQVKEYAHLIDVIQIGSRNMQNFELLKAVGKTNKPILLKRGFQATIQEFLLSAEYIMSEGNPNVILCERGIRSFEPSYRNMLDINAIIYLREKTHLPIFIDPSHGTGHDWMVSKATLAGVSAGANGAIVEMHTNKEEALSDKDQTITASEYVKLKEKSLNLLSCLK